VARRPWRGDPDWWVMAILILLLAILFGGEPDIQDGITAWLKGCP